MHYNCGVKGLPGVTKKMKLLFVLFDACCSPFTVRINDKYLEKGNP